MSIKTTLEKTERLIGICESQNHRCAVCGDRFPQQLNLYARKGVTIQRMIDDARARNYYNSVAVCTYCTSKVGVHKTLMGVYEFLIADVPVERVTYPENLDLFRSLIIARGLDPKYVKENSNIIYLDPSEVPKIASVARELMGGAPVISGPVTPMHKKETRGNRSRGLRNFLLKQQNYRCYYDDYEMELNVRTLPRSYTKEHLIRVADGGTNSRLNMVIACKICNNMREHMNMSAPEFKEWAMANRHVIQQRADLNIDATRTEKLSLDSIQGLRPD